MDKSTLIPRWSITEGLTFNVNAKRQLEPKPSSIDISETARSVSMDAGTQPYGRIIDASTAISLIHNLHQKLQLEYAAFFKELNEHLAKDASAATEKKEELDNFKAKAETFIKWITTLIERSAAITIDKSVILKTLSQPQCEGLRFYLCLKDTTEGEFISLVTVGVDEDGKDLHYNYEHAKLGGKELDTLNVDTVSAASEYAHPPGLGVGIMDSVTSKTNDFDDRFVFLKYAIGKMIAAK